jgi:hypothetical protein
MIMSELALALVGLAFVASVGLVIYVLTDDRDP